MHDKGRVQADGGHPMSLWEVEVEGDKDTSFRSPIIQQGISSGLWY